MSTVLRGELHVELMGGREFQLGNFVHVKEKRFELAALLRLQHFTDFHPPYLKDFQEMRSFIFMMY
ncbi:MAG: hypothetical protein MN733_27050 [Nitrososphaera sp.]|nr:hypothetical protein [Nitrososphaera sp.]